MAKEHMTVFPDTNVLLHFPPIKQIDWKTICDANSVKIMICMKVIHELDDKKYISQLSQRAESALKEIDELTETEGRVQDGVTIEIYPIDLDSATGDKLIIHEILDFQQNSGDNNVAVYSNDYGMRVQCKLNNIKVVRPDKGTQKSLPQTDDDRKYLKTLKELNNLKLLLPELEVYLKNNAEENYAGEPLDFIFEHPNKYLDKATVLERERSKYTIDEMSPYYQLAENLDQYYRDIETYLGEIETWVQQMNTVKDQHAMSFSFFVVVSNVDGHAPAREINAYLSFPDILSFIQGEGNLGGTILNEPNKPEGPKIQLKKGVNHDASMLGALIRTGTPILGVGIGTEFTRPLLNMKSAFPTSLVDIYGSSENGFKIRIHIEKLNHLYNKEFGPFLAAFKTWDDVHPFNIGIDIHASNLPDPIEHSILVRADVK